MSDAGPGVLWLVRHGSTEWSTTGRHTGLTDVPLTSEGELAAAALGPVLAGHEFALVLSSPLQRARRTAELAGESPQIDDDLLEWDYGQYEGRTTPEIRQERPGWSLWTDGVLGGETADDVAARADRVIARVRAAGGDCVVFAHGHLLRVLGARWIGSAPTGGQHLLLSTAAVCVLGYERETPALARWNDTSHLVGFSSS
jgi:broad specificity phosphatase PhoE